MLSYTWEYRLGPIQETLAHFCETSKLDPRRTYVWICAICINQHRVREAQALGQHVSFTEFEAEFGWRVSSIGHVLAMMEPWHAPRNLSRAWCVYELFRATTEPGCTLDILMPPEQARCLTEAVVSHTGEVSAMWSALNSVCVKRAEATVAADKEHIMRLVEQGPGIEAMNFRVRTKLQSWFKEACSQQVPAVVDRMPLASLDQVTQNVGFMFCVFDKYKVAMEVCRSSLARLEAAGEGRSEVAAGVLSVLSQMQFLSGHRAEAALAASGTAIDILTQAGRLESGNGARAMASMGMASICLGLAEQGTALLTDALRIEDTTKVLDVTSGYMLILHLAIAKMKLGDHEEALDLIHRAVAMGKSSAALALSPPFANGLLIAAYAYLHKGDLASAREVCDHARQIYQAAGIEHSVRSARIFTIEALLHYLDGEDATSALDKCRQAREMHLRCYPLCTPCAADVWTTEAFIRQQIGDRWGSARCLRRARGVRRRSGINASIADLAVELKPLPALSWRQWMPSRVRGGLVFRSQTQDEVSFVRQLTFPWLRRAATT